MGKLCGGVVLGQPGEVALARADDVDVREKAGLVWLAAGCVLLGLFPNLVIGALGHTTSKLVGAAPDTTSHPWWLLAPLPDRAASQQHRPTASFKAELDGFSGKVAYREPPY